MSSAPSQAGDATRDPRASSHESSSQDSAAIALQVLTALGNGDSPRAMHAARELDERRNNGDARARSALDGLVALSSRDEAASALVELATRSTQEHDVHREAAESLVEFALVERLTIAPIPAPLPAPTNNAFLNISTGTTSPRRTRLRRSSRQRQAPGREPPAPLPPRQNPGAPIVNDDDDDDEQPHYTRAVMTWTLVDASTRTFTNGMRRESFAPN